MDAAVLATLMVMVNEDDDDVWCQRQLYIGGGGAALYQQEEISHSTAVFGDIGGRAIQPLFYISVMAVALSVASLSLLILHCHQAPAVVSPYHWGLRYRRELSSSCNNDIDGKCVTRLVLV